MDLSQYIEEVAQGNLLSPPEKGMGVSYGKGVLKSGYLSFYFRGTMLTSRWCGSKFKRTVAMAEMLRRVKELKGERYFVWMPDERS